MGCTSMLGRPDRACFKKLIRRHSSRANFTVTVSGLCSIIAATCLCVHAAGCNSTYIHPIAKQKKLWGTAAGEGFFDRTELGVQRGEIAHRTLQKWESCVECVVVHLWKTQENYVDDASGGDMHSFPIDANSHGLHSAIVTRSYRNSAQASQGLHWL